MVGHIDGGKPRQKFVDFRNPATGFVEKIAVQEPVTTVFSNTDSDTLDIAGIFGIGRQVVTSGQEVLVAQNHLGGNRDDGSPPTSVVDVTRLLDALKHDFDFHIQGFTALEDHQQGDYGSGVVQFAIDMQGTIDRIKALLDDTAPMTAERQTELNTLLNELNIRRTVALEKKAQFQETVEPRLEEIQTQINELRKTDSKAADDAQKRFDIEKADIEKHSIYELIENVGSLEQEYRAALEQRVKTQDGAALTIDQATGQNTTQALKTKADELAQSVKDFYLSQLETSYQVSASGIELELSPSDEALAKAEETLEAGQDFIDKNASYADEREQLRQQLRQLDTQYDQLTDTAEYKAYGNEGLDKVGSTLDGTADLFAALPSNLEDLKHNVEVLARKVADAKASADKAVDNTPILDISKFEEFKKEITGLIGNNPTAKQLVEASDLIAARWQAIAPEQGGTEKANKFYIQELNKLDEEISSKVALSAINLITDKAREYSIEGTMVEPTDKKGWIRQRTETTSDVNYPDITITHPDMKEGKRLEDEDAVNILRNPDLLDTSENMHAFLGLEPSNLETEPPSSRDVPTKMADIKANIDRLLPELQSTNANSQAALDTIGQSLQSVRDDLSQAGDTLPADARQDFQSRLDEAAEQLNEQLVAFQENQAETVQVLTDIEALPGYAQRAVRAHHNAAPLNDELQKLSAQGADLQGIATELATLQNKLAEAGEAGDSEHVAEWGHEDRPLDTTYPPFVEFKEELASYNPAQDPDGEKFRSLIPNMEELLSEVHSQVGDKSSTNGYSATLNNLKDRFEKTYSQVAVQKLELALQSHQDIADQVAGIKIMADDYSFDIGGVTDRDAPSGATVTLKGGETLPLSRRQLDDIMNADPAELEKSGALDWLKELLGIKPLAAAELPDNTPPVITRDPVEADYAEVRRDLWDALGNDDRREKLWNTFDAVHTPSNEYFDSPREDETFFKVAAGGDDVITQAELDKFLETVDQTSEADLMTLAQGKYKELYPNAVEPSADYEAVFASLASLRGANGPHRGSASSVTKFKEELNTLEAAVHGNTITAEQKQRLSDLEGNYLHQMAARIQGPSERYLKQIDEEMAKLSDAERADETLQQQLAKITQQDADLRARMAALQAKAADLQAQVTKPDATPVDAEVAELEGMLDTLEGLTDEINSAMAPYRDQANAEFIQLETSLSQIEASGEPITQEQKDSLFAQLTATETYAEEAADVRNRIYNEHQKTEVQNRIRALEEQGAQGADAYQKLTERLHHMSGSTLGFLDDFDVRYQNVFRRIDALQVNNEAAPAMLQPIDPNALNLDDFQQFKAEIDQLDLNSREGLIQASDIIAAQWEKIDPDNEDPIKASDEYLEALNELDKSVSIQVSKWVKAKIDDAMQQHQVSGYSLDDSTYATYNDERTHNKHIPYVGFNHLETDTDVRLDDYIIEQILRDENALDTKQKLDSKLNLLVGTARALSDSPSEVQLEELQSVLGRFDMERLQNEMASETEAVNSALNLAEAAMAQTSASGQLSVEQEEAIQDQLSVAYTKWWEADSKRDNWMGESNASYAVRIHIDSLEEKEQAGELSGSEKQQLQELRAQWQLIVDESYESLGEAKALREQLWERLRRTPVDRQTYAVDYYDSSDEYEDADIGVQERPKQDPSTLSRIALNMYKDHPEIKEALDSIERDYLLGYEYNDKSLDGKNGREFVRIGYLVAWLQENQNNPNYGRANADVVHQEDTFNIITNEQLDTLIKAVRDGSAKNYFEKVS